MAKVYKCPVCKQPMEYIGNPSGRIYPGKPPEWDAVWVCWQDRTKLTVREIAKPIPPPDLDEFRPITQEKAT